MISKQANKNNTIPFRKSQFSFQSIDLISSDRKQAKVSVSLPGYLYSFEITLTVRRLFRYGEFQTAFVEVHGVVPYIPEVEQERSFPRRAKVWSDTIKSFITELA